jgi:hypothetical protein
MTILSPRLREVHPSEDPDFGRVLMHWCPGCKSRHDINVTKPNHWGAVWSFDGNAEQATFSPSINFVGRCHYFIRAGNIEHCGDSTHALAGQTLPLPDFPAWIRDGD